MKVSIVIPTFGRASSLRDTINSLLKQSYKAHEILIIDQNNSGWLNSAIGSFKEPVRIYNDKIPNASRARNHGFLQSDGDLILFIDDDLIAKSNFITKAVQRFATIPKLGCLCPIIETKEKTAQDEFHELLSKKISSNDTSPDLFRISDTISAAMFFTRECYEQSGGFDEFLFNFAETGEDQELCFRMNTRGLSVWIDKKLTIFHDESVPMGCQLRTLPYWHSRNKNLGSITMRTRIHNQGKIPLVKFILLIRSAFLNRNLLKKSPFWALKNLWILIKHILKSAQILKIQLTKEPNYMEANHIETLRKQMRNAELK